jgi:hypothetical protein
MEIELPELLDVAQQDKRVVVRQVMVQRSLQGARVVAKIICGAAVAQMEVADDGVRTSIDRQCTHMAVLPVGSQYPPSFFPVNAHDVPPSTKCNLCLSIRCFRQVKVMAAAMDPLGLPV